MNMIEWGSRSLSIEQAESFWLCPYLQIKDVHELGYFDMLGMIRYTSRIIHNSRVLVSAFDFIEVLRVHFPWQNNRNLQYFSRDSRHNDWCFDNCFEWTTVTIRNRLLKLFFSSWTFCLVFEKEGSRISIVTNKAKIAPPLPLARWTRSRKIVPLLSLKRINIFSIPSIHLFFWPFPFAFSWQFSHAKLAIRGFVISRLFDIRSHAQCVLRRFASPRSIHCTWKFTKIHIDESQSLRNRLIVCFLVTLCKCFFFRTLASFRCVPEILLVNAHF
jgi:hypothetical protein